MRTSVSNGNPPIFTKGSSIKISNEQQMLKVGIIGGGHVGKQLAQVLLARADLRPLNISISTRRPQSLEDFRKMGVECFYDNPRVAAWADVLFLCCLPFHLPQVCAEIRSELPQSCTVYSFVTAVPLPRLRQLLSHSSVLKPEFGFIGSGSASMWTSAGPVTDALKDPAVVAATCPLGMSGGLCVDIKWFVAVLYCLLNMCTTLSGGSQKALELMNELFLLKGTSPSHNTLQFTLLSFINASFASTLSSDEPLPWINLIDAQLKETPLSKMLSEHHALREHLTAVYCSVLGV
ncbi:NADP-dependent oxidoreductase domain-containing protein 1 isoform X2 [Amia ocellicauda]|uniref:NADP-dependent oxidoreductase domain-containing protein 1 isoform X2 n=1 Tax=Amia ocellicauda TaxID=2972642 RepID=UPI00346489CE